MKHPSREIVIENKNVMEKREKTSPHGSLGMGRRGRKEKKRGDEMPGIGPTLQRHIPCDFPPPDLGHLFFFFFLYYF